MPMRENLPSVTRMNRQTRRLAWLAWAFVLAAFVVLCLVLGYTEAAIVGLVTALLAPPAGMFGAYLARRWGPGSD
jgi:hypothetical protein